VPAENLDLSSLFSGCAVLAAELAEKVKGQALTPDTSRWLRPYLKANVGHFEAMAEDPNWLHGY
jgi:hypothetical protein